ncbi:hypothetical protein Bca4012_062818 [Brassica carinata]
MGLHNFIKISNFPDIDFASTMPETRMSNIDFESEFRDIDAVEEAHGEHMSQLRDNIANMLWENQSTR